LQAPEGVVGGFSVEAVEAMQNVPEAFDAFIRLFCAVRDLNVNPNVMHAAVAEDNADADVMLRR
jgi:hypothetical protein